MVKTYTPMHLHDHHSNINMVEVVTKFDDYVDKANELGLPTVICTNHGVLTGWYNRKKLLESKGMKYVHAVEGYVTWSLDEKVRDNFHLSLFARNYDGFKELNKLVSKSFNREDGHYYYNPRISWEEIKNTTDNIIISTACLGGLMWRLKEDDSKYNDILNWINQNKHRVFLEVQPHKHDEQKKLNKHLVNIADKFGLKLIAGGDVHALNEEHDKARKILQKSKHVIFSDEDNFDLTLKSYDELYNMFIEQNVLTTIEISEALENTNVLLNMIEPFELDYSKKYPKLYDNPDKVLKQKIKDGLKFRGIDKLPKDEISEYAKRIKYELDTYKANEAEDYLLLEDMVKTFARENNIPYGYGRGSVSGSIIAYLMKITEIDSIKRGLNFERFMSKERISLADVDSDYSPSQRHLIQKFLMDHPKLYCAPIMTANTIALKGAIRDIGRGLEMPLSTVDEIAKNIEDKEEYYRNEYPELFKYVDIVQGVITSIGQHACFDENTLVQTNNGYKKIKDVSIGDNVLTHNNRFMPVVDTMVTESKDIYNLNVGTSLPLKVTGNHPMYIREVEIKRSRKGGVDTRWREWGVPKWKNVEDINIGKDWIGIAINQNSIIPNYKEYPNLPFDNKDFWWLVGRYLGDGWTESYERKWNEKRTIICCSKKNDEHKEIQDVLDRLDKLPSTGIEFNNRIEERKTTFKFHIGSRSNHELYGYLQTFGRYASGKELNKDILNLPVNLLESFLNGYFSADGSLVEDTKVYSFKTVSKELAIGISSCVNKVYKRHCSFSIIPSRFDYIEGRKVNSKEKYNVTFTKDTRSKERSFYEDGYIWSRVKSVEKTSESNSMYNLTVLEDSSYTVNNIVAHNCGICVSPIPLDENMGLITTTDSDYPLTMLNMKEIDAQNYVKLDILGLDTTEIISETCRLAGIEFVTPQTLDQNDDKVWESVTESNVGIFQWESDFSQQVYKELFSKETISKIKKRNPNFSYIDLFSLGNAILRPSGASYRDSVIRGEFYDNGHVALNEFLSPTLGRLVYQEQQLEFLVKFCGYTGGQADLVRRGIGKKSKEIIDNELPKIEKTFIKTMTHNYELSYEEAESIAKPFLQVFLDSANYGFSVNHSEAYSWMGYACAWLRYYYPLEFITASLNVNIGKEEKTAKLIEYAKYRGIDVKPIKFRYSHAGYMFDKETNSIYQGVEPIKFLNKDAAEGLYELRDKQYQTFTDLLYEVHNNTYSNFKQLKILTKLNFFDEFGRNEKLLNVIDFYEQKLKNKKLKDETKQKRLNDIREYEISLDNKSINIKDQIQSEIEFYGYEVTKNDKLPKSVYMVTEIDSKYTPKLRLYCLNSGEVLNVKCRKNDMKKNLFGEFSIIRVKKLSEQKKKRLVDGKWTELDEYEKFLVNWDVLR